MVTTVRSANAVITTFWRIFSCWIYHKIFFSTINVFFFSFMDSKCLRVKMKSTLTLFTLIQSNQLSILFFLIYFTLIHHIIYGS